MASTSLNYLSAGGPAGTTDYSTVATVCSVAYPVINGHNYMILVRVGQTSQVTTNGTPTVKCLAAGAEFGPQNTSRLLSGLAVTAGVNIEPVAAVFIYAATSTASITFSITAQSSAGALRLNAANVASVEVVEL